MTESDWLSGVNVGPMLRHLTHEVHRAEDAIGDHLREHPLISQRKLELFDDACFHLFGLNLDDVTCQENPVAGAADLLRDVAGNPFRPVDMEKIWDGIYARAAVKRTGDRGKDAAARGFVAMSTIEDVAQGAYRDSDFDRLPILADALEEAGCDSEDLLAHLRSPGVHVRGCWALDLILGKE